MPPAPPCTRDEFLATMIGSMTGLWLLIHCGQRATHYPLRLMCQRVDRRTRLADVLPRLRCRACGGAPSRVMLTDDPRAGGHGGPPITWRLDLLNQPAPEGC